MPACHPRRPAFRFPHLVGAALLLASMVLSAATRAVAADGAKDEPAVPIAVVNVAGVERVLDDVDGLFAAADRPDLAALLRGLLGVVGDLKGLDRTRPLGVMIVLPRERWAPPTAVGYLPVTEMDDLLRTVAVGSITTRPVEGQAGRYEIITPGRTLQLRAEGRYAFVGLNAKAVEQRLPDPEMVARPLTSRYDIAASLRVGDIPEGMKTLVMDFLRASAEAELQPWPDESDARFALRRARGLSALESLDQFLMEGRELTLGAAVAAENPAVVLEWTIEAREGTPLARNFRALRQPSVLGRLFDEQAPLSAAASWHLDDRSRALFQQALTSTQEILTDENGPAAGRVAPLFDALQATVAGGHLDAVATVIGQPPGPFVLVGGVRVADGVALGKGLLALQEWAQRRGALESIEKNVATHRGVVFHRVISEAANRSQSVVRIYGREAALLIGTDADTLWFAFGGEAALPAVQEAIDRLHAPAAPLDEPSPFRLVAHATPWLGLAAADERARANQALARKALAAGDDTLRVEVQPTGNGARLRVELEKGYLRWLGLRIVREVERRGL